MTSSLEGIVKVRESQGNYAFAVTIDEGRIEIGTPPCDLMMIGEFGKSTSSGLGFRKNDPLLPRLDEGIATLKKNGIFEQIEEKWLLGSCSTSTSGAAPTAAAVVNGIVLAVFLSAFY